MKSTQVDAILAYLQSGRPLTSGDALRLYGCARLAARVFELRQAGYDIRNDLIEVDTQHGGKAHVAAYYMTKAGELF